MSRSTETGSSATDDVSNDDVIDDVSNLASFRHIYPTIPATKVLAKITNCTRRAINLNNFVYKNEPGTLVAVG